MPGRFTLSAACLHAVVLALEFLRVGALNGKIGAPHKERCFGTQAWQEVAPYSSRHHPHGFACLRVALACGAETGEPRI